MMLPPDTSSSPVMYSLMKLYFLFFAHNTSSPNESYDFLLDFVSTNSSPLLIHQTSTIAPTAVVASPAASSAMFFSSHVSCCDIPSCRNCCHAGPSCRDHYRGTPSCHNHCYPYLSRLIVPLPLHLSRQHYLLSRHHFLLPWQTMLVWVLSPHLVLII